MTVRRLLLALLALLLPTALVAPVAGQAAQAAVRTKLVAKLVSTTVPSGGEARLKGTLKAGKSPLAKRKVLVQRKVAGSRKFVTVGKVKTNKKGKWKFRQSGQKKTADFRAKFKGSPGYKPSVSKPVRLTVSTGTPTPPEITTRSLPLGTVGVLYSTTLQATGTKPITWELASGELPRNFTLDSDGRISGRTGSQFDGEITVRALNSYGADSATFGLTIRGAMSITTTALSPASVGQPYAASLAAAGATAPLVWTAVGLPPGLSISAAGQITGTATTPGTSNPTFEVTYACWRKASRTLPLQVVAYVSLTLITPSLLSYAHVGQVSNYPIAPS